MNCKIQKIKQNKKIVAIIIVMLMVTSMLSMSVFAYTDTSTNGVDFTDQPYTMSDYPSESQSLNTANYFLIWFTSEANYYVALVNVGGSYRPAVIYDNADGSGKWYYNRSSGTWNSSSRSPIGALEGYYYNYIQTNYSTSSISDATVPVFDSSTDFISAVADWIENPPAPPETPHTFSYDLAPGYVAFIDIHGLTNIGGSVNTSSAVALAPSDFIATNQLYGYTNSIPSTFNLPLTGSMSYSWNASKTNVWGKSQQWFWTGTYTGGSNYLFIANPTYSNLFGQQSNGTSMVLDNPSATNSYIHIFLRECYSIKIVSLKAEFSYDPAQGSYGAIDNGNGDTIIDGTYDSETGQWQYINNQTGEVVGSELPVGGENDIQTPTSSDSIIGWLQTISNQISGFFNGAVGAISTLVQAGSSFFRVLTGLYSWLPVSVLSVLTSALVLIITIGFIKVFL